MTEVLDTIREFAVPLTVNRPTGEDRAAGFGGKTYTAITGVQGHMQPLSPRELRFVPEGENTLEWYHVWSLSEIKEDDLVTDGTAPTVLIARLEYWKEAGFWHGQGSKVTDRRILPGGSGSGSMEITGSGEGGFS